MARAVLVFVAPSFIFLAAFLCLRPDSAPETWEPGEIAEHLVASEGYSLHRYAGYPEPSANAEPCYTLLLAAFLKWVPYPYVSLIAFQVLGWFATSFLIGRLSHQWLGAPQRLVTLVVALWPPLAAYVLSYHPLWLRAAALTVALTAATRYSRLPSTRRAAELGFALGIAALVRTTFLVLPVVLLPWALSRDDRSGRIRHGALAVTIAVFVLSPWLIRNRMALWVPGYRGRPPPATRCSSEAITARMACSMKTRFTASVPSCPPASRPNPKSSAIASFAAALLRMSRTTRWKPPGSTSSGFCTSGPGVPAWAGSIRRAGHGFMSCSGS